MSRKTSMTEFVYEIVAYTEDCPPVAPLVIWKGDDSQQAYAVYRAMQVLADKKCLKFVGVIESRMVKVVTIVSTNDTFSVLD